MNKEDIMNYVMNTPGNTNPNVLGPMLDELGDNRFIVTFTYDEPNDIWNADKTFEECVAAWNNGKMLFAMLGGFEMYIPMSAYAAIANHMEFVIMTADLEEPMGFVYSDEGIRAVGGNTN